MMIMPRLFSCSFSETKFVISSYTRKFGEGTYSLTRDVTKIQGYAHLAVYKRKRISPSLGAQVGYSILLVSTVT